MKASKIKPIITLLLASIMLAACSAGTATAEVSSPEPTTAPAINTDENMSEAVATPINVTVSILPEKYFVERIGGDYVNANVMVGPGNSPHTYEPKSDQMTALSQASIYFSIGVDFEDAWMDRIAAANPDMQIVNVSANIEKIPMSVADDDEESGSPDPHVWTSPENVKIIAQSIYEALVKTDPAHQAEYQANLESFQTDIGTLETDIQSALSGITSTKFLVFHPAWGYFAHEFGLEQIAIEIGGSEPSAQELAAIIDEAKKDDIKVVFGAPEFSSKTADYIAQEINGQVVLIDPLAEDWLANLQNVAGAFAEALKN